MEKKCLSCKLVVLLSAVIGAMGLVVELSMGMSQDYEIAVEEGATILRVGSAIFAG